MRTLQEGHRYALVMRRGDGQGLGESEQMIGFVNREPGHEEDGTTTQEVLRALIDRTHYCDNCLPTKINEQIIHHMRMALVLHEARALIRKVEKGELMIERLETGNDGHLLLPQDISPTIPSYYRDFTVPTTDTGGANPGTPCHTPVKPEEPAFEAAASQTVGRPQMVPLDLSAQKGETEYLIYSVERHKWWGPGEHGYVDSAADAGRYLHHQAKHICQQANFALAFGATPNELMLVAP